MSPGEMHRLEIAALNDPFLADAIEGMQQAKGTFDKDVVELKKRLNKKVRSNNISTWWKAAAVFIVVGTGIAVSYTLMNNSHSKAPVVSEVMTKRKDTAQTFAN